MRAASTIAELFLSNLRLALNGSRTSSSELTIANQRKDMKDYNDKNFNARQAKAATAKMAMLQRAQRPPADDTMALQRKTERQAIVAAREARNGAKALAAIEQAAREEAEKSEQAALREQKEREEADRAVALLAEQKALRNARYAARKKRKA